jgi:hypothetical protein
MAETTTGEITATEVLITATEIMITETETISTVTKEVIKYSQRKIRVEVPVLSTEVITIQKVKEERPMQGEPSIEEMKVAGLTTPEVAQSIGHRLKGMQ